MADGEVIVKTKVVAETGEAEQRINKYLDHLKKKAKETSSESSSAFGSMSKALGGVSSAARIVRGVLSGFGALGAITGLIAAVGKLKESFSASKKELDELVAAKDKAEHKEAVDNLAKSYEALGEAAKNAAAALQHQNEMLDISVKNARDLEDAQLNLAEQKELAAVDGDDLAASEARAQISARYAQRRGALAAARGKEDVVYQRQRLQGEADAKRRDAAGIEGSLANDDRVIAEARRRLADAQTRSVSENDADATGVMAGWGNNLKNIFTGNWGKVGLFGFGEADNRTAAGDAERAKAKTEVEELEAEIKQLQEQKAAKLKEAERLRQEAAWAEEKKDALGGQIAVSDVRRETADVAGQAGVAAADRAREKKEAQIARDEEIIAAGPGRITAIKRKIAAAEAQKSSAIDADAREQSEAEQARSALEGFDLAHPRRNATGVQSTRSALEEDVRRETAEANQSRVQLQSTLATLAATLKDLNADLQKVEREVDAAKKRTRRNEDES